MTEIAWRSVLGIAGQGMLLAAGSLAVPSAGRILSRKGQGALAVLVFAAVVAIPLGGATLAEYLRGTWGDISVTTWALLAAAMTEKLSGRPLLSSSARVETLALVVASAILLYPTALGLSSFDPYAAGFRPLVMVIVLFAYSAWAWHRGSDAAWIPMAAALAFDARLMESSNLWDYLVDPLVATYALGFALWQAFSRRRA